MMSLGGRHHLASPLEFVLRIITLDCHSSLPLLHRLHQVLFVHRHVCQSHFMPVSIPTKVFFDGATPIAQFPDAGKPPVVNLNVHTQQAAAPCHKLPCPLPSVPPPCVPHPCWTVTKYGYCPFSPFCLSPCFPFRANRSVSLLCSHSPCNCHPGHAALPRYYNYVHAWPFSSPCSLPMVRNLSPLHPLLLL